MSHCWDKAQAGFEGDNRGSCIFKEYEIELEQITTVKTDVFYYLVCVFLYIFEDMLDVR